MITALSTTGFAKAYLLAGLLSCAPQQPAAVDTVFNNHPPRQINELSSKQLGDLPVDTTFSHSAQEVFTTGGITQGHVGSRYEVGFSKQFDPGKTQFCLFMTDIKVVIDYKPDVYIASEYAEGTCHYKVTLEHEIRHVNTDIITLNETIPRITAAAKQAAYAIGTAGPVSEAQLAQVQADMQQRLKIAIDKVLEDFDRVRHQRQQGIDTRQEYMRLARICPPEKKKR